MKTLVLLSWLLLGGACGGHTAIRPPNSPQLQIVRTDLVTSEAVDQLISEVGSDYLRRGTTTYGYAVVADNVWLDVYNHDHASCAIGHAEDHTVYVAVPEQPIFCRRIGETIAIFPGILKLVIAHEIGHLLGYPDGDAGLMKQGNMDCLDKEGECLRALFEQKALLMNESE